MSKTIVITGCSSGFGRVTAFHLARLSWHVFATVRKEADKANLMAEATKYDCIEYITPVICDITKADQVASLGRTVAEALPQLDALLNNAGTAFPSPMELITLDELRSQMEINLIGHMAVTQTLLPLLKTASGIIINVTSVGGRIALPVIGAYNASKFAMEAVSDVLRVELAPFGVRVVVIEPGTSATSIWETSRSRAGRLMQGAPDNPYTPLLASFDKYFKEEVAHGFPLQLFADTVLKILNDPNPHTRYAIPGRVAWIIFLRKLLPDRIWDRMIRRTMNW
ncbi:MAG: SDR family NAD(P)-dependent oxidoreductase [Thermodesulfobacteriota bacterium]